MPELQAGYVNISSNQSTRNNFRTAERGIILIKTLIETKITLPKAANSTHITKCSEKFNINLSLGVFNGDFSLAWIEIQNALW